MLWGSGKAVVWFPAHPKSLLDLSKIFASHPDRGDNVNLLLSPPRLPGSTMLSRRRGLTIVELLVIVFCLFVVLALLFPAIDATRPRRRNQCSTQLKNLALAAIQYENAKGRLPGYVIDFGTSRTSKAKAAPPASIPFTVSTALQRGLIWPT
jgi:hypothetical protein